MKKLLTTALFIGICLFTLAICLTACKPTDVPPGKTSQLDFKKDLVHYYKQKPIIDSLIDWDNPIQPFEPIPPRIYSASNPATEP